MGDSGVYWLRLIGGGAAGLVAAAIVYFVIERLSHGWFGETWTLIALLVAYSLGAMTGGAVGAKIGGANASYIVAALFSLVAATTAFAFPHPWWFLPSAIVLIFGNSFVGSKFVSHPED